MEIDSSANCVRRDGQEHYLRPKTFQVLLHLVRNRDRIVTKEELLAAVWPDTAVTEDTLVQSIVDIRKAVGDDSRDPWFLRTVPRVGYRVIASVAEGGAVARPADTHVAPAAVSDPATRHFEIEERQSFEMAVVEEEGDWRRFIPHFALGFVILVLGGIAAYLMLRRDEPAAATSLVPSRRQTTIVVAPFTNRSQVDDLQWLVDGLPAMVSTQLARAEELSVVGSDTVARLTRKHETGDAGDDAMARWVNVAKDARASRVVAGTFEQVGDQIRIDAQIHDVTRGRVVGGGSVVSKRESLLEDVDVLTSKLAAQLGTRLVATGNDRLTERMTDDLDAYEAYMRGVAASDGMRNLKAIEHLERAITLDPGFAMAHARIGYAYAVTWALPERAKPYFEKALALGERLEERERLHILGWQAIAAQDYQKAIEHLRMLVTRYPTDIEAYTRLGRVYIGEERLKDAVSLLRRALVIDPEAPEVRNVLGIAESYLGNHEAAIEQHRRFVEIAPTEPNAYDSLGLSYQWAGDYGRALDSFERALDLDPEFEVASIHRSNVLWELGRNREGIAEVRRYLELSPSDTERNRGLAQLYWIYRSMGENERAAEMATAVAREPTQAHHYGMLAAVARGDAAAAAHGANNLPPLKVSGRGNRIPLRFEYAVRAEGLKAARDPRALEFAREAVRHLPPTYFLDGLEDTFGDALATFGRDRDAVAEYRRVLSINPNRGRTRYKMALAMDRLGQKAQARAELERFLQIWKDADEDAPEVIDAQRRLRVKAHAETAR